MKQKIFTLLTAFLTMVGNAVWGQEDGAVTINITGIESQAPNPSSGTGWTAKHATDITKEGNTLTISKAGTYIIKDEQSSGTDNSNVQIIVNENLGEVNITVEHLKTNAQLGNDLNGSGTKYPKRCAFEINSGTTVRLSWTGDNKFWSSSQRAGINVKQGATLILAGPESGSLEAGSLENGKSHTYGAGIGGDSEDADFGTIIIESGTIRASSESKGQSVQCWAAGIGGGFEPGASGNEADGTGSTSGSIIIKGGNVTAASYSDNGNGTENNDSYGAGIGGGYKGTVTDITITGGTVKADSRSGKDIGTGKTESGTNVTAPQVIIAAKDKETKPNVTADEKSTGTYLNTIEGEYPTLNGTVTLPEGIQIYSEGAIVSETGRTFNAYNVTVNRSTIDDEEGHQVSGTETMDDRQYYYYGKKTTFEQLNLSCNKQHLFMGWTAPDAPEGMKIVNAGDKNATFTMPDKDPTKVQTFNYYAAWVDNEYPITAVDGTEWAKDGENTPKVAIAGNEEFLLENLTFKLSNDEELRAATEGAATINVHFEQNQLVGSVDLTSGNYAKETLKATVKLGENGTEKELTIPITVVEEVAIGSVEASTKSHVYNGGHHNGYDPNEVGHLLNVSIDEEIVGAEKVNVREGVHYRISEYQKDGKKYTAEGKESVELIDAGTYSGITIETLDGATLSDNLEGQVDHKTYTLQGNIEIAAREANVSFELPERIADIDDLKLEDLVLFEKQNENRGLMDGEEDYKLSGTIETKAKVEGGNTYTVTIKGFKIEDGQKFKASNYAIKINGTDDYTEGEDITIEGEVTEDPNIGGGGTVSYNQLHLAKSEGASLSSRHNKMRVKDGGSFTISMALSEGYEDCQPTVYVKRGRFGEWKEQKVDEVSGYYQIRNVYTDIWVKVSGDGIWAVANEDIEAREARAYTLENKIVVVTPQPEDVYIISMAGAMVANGKVTGQSEFSDLPAGIYIVRIGEETFKVNVR